MSRTNGRPVRNGAAQRECGRTAEDPRAPSWARPLACACNCTYDLHQARKLISLAARTRSLHFTRRPRSSRSQPFFSSDAVCGVRCTRRIARTAAPATATCINHALIFITPASPPKTRRAAQPTLILGALSWPSHVELEGGHREQLLCCRLPSECPSNHRARPSQASPGPQTPNRTQPTVAARGAAVHSLRSPPTSA